MIDSRLRLSRKRVQQGISRRRRTLETLEPRQLLASLAGEVWADLNANGQRDPTEPGAAEVRVYLDGNDNGQVDPFERTAITNNIGQFAFNQVFAGTHVVRVDLGTEQTQTSPRAYYGSGYTALGDGSGNNPTQLYEMSEAGRVRPIGQPTGNRIHGLIRTNDGVFFGVNHFNDSLYTIDALTGQETLLSKPGPELVAGLAYDPQGDKIYTVGRQDLITNVFRLYEVGRDGSVLPIGPGMTGLQNVSDLTFDTSRNRIVGFDNSDDEFFAFDLLGNGTSLSKADRALDSWSLAYNGTSFVMFDQGDPERKDVLRVNPDTGLTQFSFEADVRIPTEALFFATSGNVAQRVQVSNTNMTGINFGVFGRGNGAPGSGSGPGLGGLYINELMIDPLFGNADTDQYVEIRGDAGAMIADNTYLVIVDDNNSVGSINVAGEIHGIFDLSNQQLGSNGFLVLLEQGAPYTVDPNSAVLQSNETGFGGLPGDIYSDLHPLSERIDFIVGSNTFFLVQTDVPPVLGADIDVGDDGIADPTGVIADWTIFDSISLHPWVSGGNQAYGQIVMVEEGLGVPNPLIIPPAAELVIGPGFGYAARVGDSIGSAEADWVAGTVRNEAASGAPLRYGLESGIFGIPTQPAFQGRDLDHVGESNFVGGVRGHVILESTDPSLPPDPAAGVTVFADVNGNGRQDNLLHIVDPSDVPAGTNLINRFPGVTINTADSNNQIVGFAVTAEQQRNFPNTLPNRIFARGGIDWFPESSRLRFDLYEPANTVSIVGIADDSAFLPTYMRLDAYDADDNLLGTVLSNQLISSSSQLLTLSFPTDIIAYAVAYADQSVTNANGTAVSSTPFGRLDRFSYRQLEASDVTDQNGFYEITNLFPDQYQVTFLNAPGNPPLAGAEPVPITINRYENFVLGPNDAPVAADLFASIDENSPVGTIVGTVVGSDAGSGVVSYSIVGGNSQGILINENTGELVVGSNAVLDFEATPNIVFQVGVSDPLSSTTVATVTVSLNDLNETPIVTNDPFLVAEDTENGTSIGQIQATDPDTAQNQSLTFNVIGGSAVGIFDVNPTNGIVTLVNSDAIDFEFQSELDLMVTVSDNGTPSLSDTIVQVIRLIDSNDAPTITTTQLFVTENSRGVVGQIQVTDPDQGQTHQFILTGGLGANLFDVTASGAVVVKPNAIVDFETNDTYPIFVTVVDSGAPPLADSAEITIRILDLNEPPTLQPAAGTVAENSAPGTLVTTITPIDPEGAPENYVISLVNNNDFTFDNQTGELRVAAGANLDFEAKVVHSLLFQIVDTTQQTQTVQTPFTVRLTDVNDAPRIITQRINVSESAPSGSAVGEIRVSDPDVGDTLITEIIGGTAAGLFTLNSSTRVLSVAANTQLDAESGDELTLEVQVTDSGSLTDTKTITIVLNDVNEPPVFGATLDIPPAISGKPFEFAIPPDFVVDPEGGSFVLSVFGAGGTLPSWLTFNSQTHVLSGMPSPALVGTYSLTIRAFEAGPPNLFSNFSFELEVTPGQRPFNNQRNPLDVDNNRSVVASDALRILNFIRDHGQGVITTPLSAFTGFVDVNADGKATVLDALLVVNALVNQQILGQGELIGLDDDRGAAIDAAIVDFSDALLF